MWWRKAGRFWSSGLRQMKDKCTKVLCWGFVCGVFCIMVCGSQIQNALKTVRMGSGEQNIGGNFMEDSQGKMGDSDTGTQGKKENLTSEVEQIAEICGDIYQKAAKADTLDNLETVRDIINRLGENDCPTVDSENQIDMVCAEDVLEFCQFVEAKKEGNVTILVISYDGGFTQYDLTTSEGKVVVTRTYYVFGNGNFECRNTATYAANSWEYTKEGYLFFEEAHMSGYDGPPGYTALRILPLDETCRELNRKYMLPVGYGLNDFFLSDWSEEDFSGVDFYDLFDIFYPMVQGQENPYVADENCGVGKIYQIPKEEFEDVIMRYLKIDSETLQAKTTYIPKENSYEYRPRGLEDCESPEVPYPEVVGYKENKDGTITLTVYAVYPYEKKSKVLAHEVVVRPQGNQGFQYVSNHVIFSEENVGESWHVERLTEEEWNEIYGNSEKGYDLPVSDKESVEAEADCLNAMERIQDIYMQAEKQETSDGLISSETICQMVARMKETGCPVMTKDTYGDMENYDKMENFLRASTERKSGSVIVYKILDDGSIGRDKYIFDGTNMYLLGARASWDEDKTPEFTYVTLNRIKEWKYTDKGWLCYQLCVPEYPEVTEVMDGSRLVRVKPMKEAYREMSEKCVRLLGYQGNNLLRANWDKSHLQDLDYNGLFEYLYQMKYQEKLSSEAYPNGIPKEEFESLIMAYFPITQEEIRNYAVFDAENQTYRWERLGCFNYAPTFFGTSVPEVVDIKENKDGTLTLTVDAVCEMILCDDAVITSELTIQLSADGSFQYLENKILGDGLKNIPEYQYRLGNQ